MAFVIIKALQITGALDAMGAIFSPIMAVPGLPGEAVAVLIGAWMSMGGAVGVVITLFDQDPQRYPTSPSWPPPST